MTTYRLKHLVTNPVVKADVNGSGRIDLEDIESGGAAVLTREEIRRARTGQGVRFEPGDVLFGKLRPYLQKSLLCDRFGLCSPELLVLRPAESLVDPRFLHHLIRSTSFAAWADATSKGTKMPRTDFEALGDFEFDLPSLDEQGRVAEFLDSEIALVESRMAMTRRMERLIKERQRAFVHAEVAGLNSQGPRQTTGVPWLGEIPASWKVRRLRHCVRLMQTGSTPPTADARYYSDGSLPWFGPGAFGEDLALGTPSRLLHASAVAERVAPQFPAGATLVVTIGATTGRVAQLESPGSSNQQVTALVAGEDMNPRFLAWHLKALEPVLSALASVTTLPILGREVVEGIPIAAPPPGEQAAIARRIDDKNRRVAGTTHLLSRHRELLTERREALITAAVTGELDPTSYRASAVPT